MVIWIRDPNESNSMLHAIGTLGNGTPTLVETLESSTTLLKSNGLAIQPVVAQQPHKPVPAHSKSRFFNFVLCFYLFSLNSQ